MTEAFASVELRSDTEVFKKIRAARTAAEKRDRNEVSVEFRFAKDNLKKNQAAMDGG